jgi:hypothetical protein
MDSAFGVWRSAFTGVSRRSLLTRRVGVSPVAVGLRSRATGVARSYNLRKVRWPGPLRRGPKRSKQQLITSNLHDAGRAGAQTLPATRLDSDFRTCHDAGREGAQTLPATRLDGAFRTYHAGRAGAQPYPPHALIAISGHATPVARERNPTRHTP